MAREDEEQEDMGAVEMRKQEFRSRYKDIKDLTKLAKIMKAVQDTQKREKAQLSMTNAEFDVLRLEVIPNLMEEQDVEKITIDGVGRVSLTGDMYVKVKPGMKDKLFKWLRARKMGSLVAEDINSSTLKSFVKTRTKDGKELPDGLLNITPFTRASITKA